MHLLAHRSDKVSAPANATTTLNGLNLTGPLSQYALWLVVLTLASAAARGFGRTSTGRGRDDRSQQKLNAWRARATVKLTPSAKVASVVSCRAAKSRTVPHFAAKLVLSTTREPAYAGPYSDNYVTVLPGEPAG